MRIEIVCMWAATRRTCSGCTPEDVKVTEPSLSSCHLPRFLGLVASYEDRVWLLNQPHPRNGRFIRKFSFGPLCGNVRRVMVFWRPVTYMPAQAHTGTFFSPKTAVETSDATAKAIAQSCQLTMTDTRILALSSSIYTQHIMVWSRFVVLVHVR